MRTTANFNFTYDKASESEAKVSTTSYDVYLTKIAGINRYVSAFGNNYGLVGGYVIAEPTNQYDQDAMAVYDSSNNKLLGYIPKSDLKEFREWSKCRKFPFIGKIVPFFTDDWETKLMTHIHVIKPYENNDKVTNEEIEYYKQLYLKEIEKDLETYYSKVNRKNNSASSFNQSLKNNNGGCFTGILILILLTLTALL